MHIIAAIGELVFSDPGDHRIMIETVPNQTSNLSTNVSTKIHLYECGKVRHVLHNKSSGNDVLFKI